MRVDFHTHIIPSDFPDFAAKFGSQKWPVLQKTCSCGGAIYVAGRNFRDVTDQVWDPETRIRDMFAEGVDLQVLSPIPVTFAYWAPAHEALEVARLQNDLIAEVVRAHPNRFAGLGTVPLQDVSLAVGEMDRCIQELGLQGIEIGSNVNGKNLDDESLVEFFETAARRGVPVFVHPWETLGRDRTPRHNLMYTVGMPSETALAGASLICSGMLERYPDLKICLAHGGGSLPYLLPRLDQGWQVWPHLRCTANPPSYYARQLYFDSLVYDERNLRYMLDKFGHERIFMGSDYPFLLREVPPGQVVDRLELSQVEKSALLGGNALKFLGLGQFAKGEAM